MNETAPRAEYGIDLKAFVVAWETSETVEVVERKLAVTSREIGLPPMPRSIILARAAGYRRQGIKLRKFKPGRKSCQTDELNKFIEDIRSGLNPDVPHPTRRFAAPPELNEERIKKCVQEMLLNLQQGSSNHPG